MHTETENTNHEGLIIDADEHFTINTETRVISNGANKKLTLMQYDHNSERYSFTMNRVIDGHDLTLCNRVRIHFNNFKSSSQNVPGTYPVEDVAVDPTTSDIDISEQLITFSWLISKNATTLVGTLRFLVSFECVDDDGETILYRWSSLPFENIKIASGMKNEDVLVETYSDELLAFENRMETEFIPNLMDQSYINVVFAEPSVVAAIFNVDPDVSPVIVTPYEEVTDADIDGLFNEGQGV